MSPERYFAMNRHKHELEAYSKIPYFLLGRVVVPFDGIALSTGGKRLTPSQGVAVPFHKTWHADLSKPSHFSSISTAGVLY
jgi:hypothetical protein